MKSWLRITLIIFVFLLINLIFNFSLWKEFFGNKIMVNDNIITEFLVEQSYQNILHLRNPFLTKSIFYPFTTNFSMNDPNTAYVLPFFILRPFFDPHKSLLFITLFSFFLNNFIMYFLLVKLKINDYAAFLSSLIFSFTPFLSQRLLGGHLAYIPIFYFPLTFLIINYLLKLKRKSSKIYISCLFGLLMAVILLSSFYYFFMIVLGLLFYGVYNLFIYRVDFFTKLKEGIVYILISVVTTIFFLIPWIISVYDLIKTQGLVKSPGFGGAITLSADVLSFFTPNEYNPFYKKIFSFLSFHIPYFFKYEHFYLNSFERFVYPGIIIIFVYFSIIILKILKKYPSNLWFKIRPHFFLSIVFGILMLGPFLKVFNRWSINLDGVAVVFPLPFLLLHYIPGLSTLRAPSRFTPIFIFFSCIVAAYIFDFLIEKVGKKKSLILIITLFIVFFLDQFYVIPTKLNQKLPSKIYNYLNKKPQGTVLEIPFTVRDGFQYIGFVHAIQPMAGQLIHKKPIIGGYLARVPDKVFSYYKNLRFIGYLAKIIDKGNYNQFKDRPKEPEVFSFPYDLKVAKTELDNLNVGYIILKENEKYSKILKDIFTRLNFVGTLNDNEYILLEKYEQDY